MISPGTPVSSTTYNWLYIYMYHIYNIYIYILYIYIYVYNWLVTNWGHNWHKCDEKQKENLNSGHT